MRMNLTSGKFLFGALLLLASASCKKEAGNEMTRSKNLETTTTMHSTEPGQGTVGALEAKLIRSVHSANAKYNSSTLAIKDGYQPDDHCVSVPGLGGMGYHWANPALVDEIFDPLKPEVLLYTKGPGGKFQLIGVEYIVINTGQAQPMFGNQPFEVGGTPLPMPHWSLHAWIFEPNPSGMFAPFNPNITCP
ncbi:MAG TPA: hypothetical protein VF476_17885 [Chitinophagaceae bacterium]